MLIKCKIRKGDEVIAIAGKNQGQAGEVLRVFPKDRRILVKGFNVVKRHVKPSMATPEGGIIEKELPIDVSNVQILDPETKKPTRIGYKTLEDGRKVRYAKKSGKILD